MVVKKVKIQGFCKGHFKGLEKFWNAWKITESLGKVIFTMTPVNSCDLLVLLP